MIHKNVFKTLKNHFVYMTLKNRYYSTFNGRQRNILKSKPQTNNLIYFLLNQSLSHRE